MDATVLLGLPVYLAVDIDPVVSRQPLRTVDDLVHLVHVIHLVFLAYLAHLTYLVHLVRCTFGGAGAGAPWLATSRVPTASAVNNTATATGRGISSRFITD